MTHATQGPPTRTGGVVPMQLDRAQRWVAGWWSGVLPIVAGGLLVAAAYSAGRYGQRDGTALYWLGQLLIWGPSAVLLLSPRTDTRTRVAILIAIGAMQAMLTWAYSPDQFRFVDELSHTRTLENILRTHHLFSANSFLPVSPAFPGLEIATDALMTFTRLPIFTAGVIVATASHTVVLVFLFLAFRELTGSDRTAALAAYLYATAPHFGYLESLFIYSTPSIAFFALAFRAMVRAVRGHGRVSMIAVPFVPMLLTHHLTTLAALLVLAAVTFVVAVRGSRQLAVRFAVLTVAIGAAVIAWIAALSPSTFSYLAAPAFAAIQALSAQSTGAATNTISPSPAWETLAALATAGLLLVGSLIGAALTGWSRASRTSTGIAFLCIIYPAVLAVRLGAAGGTEVAADMLTYAMVLVALPVAIALEAAWSVPLPRAAPAGAVLCGCLLALGGITTGLPASWERLPGTFHIAGFESGIDDRVAAVGHWAGAHWAPGTTVTCDFDTCSTIGGYSRATVSSQASQVFYSPTTNALNEQIANLQLDYLVTDQRWTTLLPPTGNYFFFDTRAGDHTHPLPAATITRIDDDPFVDRVYDDGLIHVYNTSGVFAP